MRGSRLCNLNSDDIYCQAVLVHWHPPLPGHESYSAPAGRRGQRKTLSPFPFLCLFLYCNCPKDPRQSLSKNPSLFALPLQHLIGPELESCVVYCLVECHIYGSCTVIRQTPSNCILEDVPSCLLCANVTSLHKHFLNYLETCLKLVSYQTSPLHD